MFKIYHVKRFKKIGTTYRDVRVRITEQFRVSKYGHVRFEILVVHDNEEIAAQRERELQIQYGYSVDKCKYDFKRLSDNGKIMGSINGKKNKKNKVQKPKGISTSPIPINVFDKTQNKTYEFPSIKQAAKFFGIKSGYITNVLRGKIKKTKKYCFSYRK